MGHPTGVRTGRNFFFDCLFDTNAVWLPCKRVRSLRNSFDDNWRYDFRLPYMTLLAMWQLTRYKFYLVDIFAF